MRELGRRLLIGLAVGVAGLVAIGYAFIFGGIATPVGGDRGVLDIPPSGEARATILDDGLPVYVVNDPESGAVVLDAQGPHAPSTLGALVAWCPATRTFVDPIDGSAFAMDGGLIDGRAGGGLLAFATRAAADDPTRVVVGSATIATGAATNPATPDATCDNDDLVAHQPAADEVFDPSVAVEREAPGWLWLEGWLERAGDGVRLCDAGAPDCSRAADVTGINPATIGPYAGDGTSGLFLGRVRDDAIESLILVPRPSEAS